MVILISVMSCHTKIKEREPRPVATSTSLSPQEILRLSSENSDILILGVDESTSLSELVNYLEWEQFEICQADELSNIIVAQRYFRNESFYLQVQLQFVDDFIKTKVIWSLGRYSGISGGGFHSWQKAYNSKDYSSRTSRAFAFGVHHVHRIPHTSISFENGFTFEEEEAGFGC